MVKYRQAKIEPKWAKFWQEKRIYQPDLRWAKKPFGKTQGKPFGKTQGKPFGKTQGKPFGKTQGKPFYNLMMFPYPSAEGLHVGNTYAFVGSDIYGRFKRMQGYDVFEPIGLDGFGIHSENYALKVGRHPVEQAKISEKNFYRQLSLIGNSFAWEQRLETYDPAYYRWTQWIFIQMFKNGLAYRKKAAVNFCPSCKTVLSDEQVIAGACERCKTMVVKKELAQWFFKITKYADRLLENLDWIDWSEKVKIAQRNWIGKKMGINIEYPMIDKIGQPVKRGGKPLTITCFTTRPDTNFGATFVVLAPEHPMVEKIVKTWRDWGPRHLRDGRLNPPAGGESHDSSEVEGKVREIRHYVEQTKKKTPMERVAEGREKTGVFTGLYCLNQLNNYKMPIYISDFVLMEFGTGAVVGVPAHDQRDLEFAKQFGLPIIQVIKPSLVIVNNIFHRLKSVAFASKGRCSTASIHPPEVSGGFLEAFSKDKGESRNEALKRLDEKIQKGKEAYDGPGVLINSSEWNGLRWPEDKEKIFRFLEKKGWGKRVASFRLRDWCISRQRYWGPPIPMIYCASCAKKGISWWDTESTKDTPGVARRDSPGVEKLRKSMAGWFPVPESQLPVLLPKVKDWRPKGEGKGPLDKIPEFYKANCPQCGRSAKRETDVSDTFLDSAWYFLRYPSIRQGDKDTSDGGPKCEARRDSSEVEGKESLPWDSQITKKWLPVNMYIGGAEHSVLHLLYSRFLTMVFKDLGLLVFEEPFRTFRAHGLLISEGAKMSKSRGNIVIPDQYIKKYGADTLRMYLMFLGPFDQGGDFRDVGIRGIYRFLERVWRMVHGNISKSTSDGDRLERSASHDSRKGTLSPRDFTSSEVKSDDLNRIMHQTIKKVTEDIENLHYNTAIAALMNYLNEVGSGKWEVGGREYKEAIKTLLLLLAPFAPFITEELWQKLNQSRNWSIHQQPWPKYDKKWLEEEEVRIVVEVDGRVRGEIKIKAKKSKIKKDVEEKARQELKVKKYLEGKKIKRVVFVPGRLMNFVIGE